MICDRDKAWRLNVDPRDRVYFVLLLALPCVMLMGQILAIASSEKRDGLKMIHAASCTPFTNWPTERTPVRYPFAMDFSPGGGFFALGNDRGCVMLYRLRHFSQA